MKQQCGGLRSFLAGAALVLSAMPAGAIPITFTGSSGNLSAKVTFDASGTTLIVTLENTSLSDVLTPSDVLTAVFFNVSGDPLLTRTSAVTSPGSAVVLVPSGAAGPTNPLPNGIGGEWAYVNGLNTFSANSGISSTGLNLFGLGDRFPGTNLAGPDSPDGVQYGILSQGDNLATGNGGLTGTNGGTFIQNSATFTLGSFSGTISDVTFLYGTSLTEPSFPGTPQNPTGPSTEVPEPATLLLLGPGIAAVWARRGCRRA
jgi:PEP-CTERM motif